MIKKLLATTGILLAICPYLLFAFTYVLNTTNYTYSTQAKPAKNASYNDPQFNTQVTRITAAVTDWGATGYGIGANYSTWNPFSADETYVLLYGIQSLSAQTDAGWRLYNASTHAYVKQVVLSCGTNDCQDPEPRWDYTGGCNHCIIWRHNKTLLLRDLDTDIETTLHDFTADFPSQGSTYYVYNGQEGAPSDDGRYYALMLRNGGTPFNVAFVFVYDRTLDSVVAQRSGLSPDSVSMSGSGNYLYLNNAFTGSGTETDGPHAYVRSVSTLATFKKTGNDSPHYSFAMDKQGHEVVHYLLQDHIGFTRLDIGEDGCTGSNFGNPLCGRFHIYYQADLAVPDNTWAGANLLHMRSAYNKPGWAFINLYSDSTLPQGWAYNQIFAIELDETKYITNPFTNPYNVCAAGGCPRVWRISPTQNYVDDSGGLYYYQQPNGQMNASSTKIVWGANWRDRSNSNGIGEVYQADLPSTWYTDLSGTLTGKYNLSGKITASGKTSVQ